MLITNWYPDPDLYMRDFNLENAKTVFSSSPEPTVKITPVTIGNAAAATVTVTDLPAGALFTCRATINIDKGPANYGPLTIADKNWARVKIGEKDTGDNRWHAEFTVPTDGTVRVRFYTPSVEGASITIHGADQMFLGLNSDYAALQQQFGLRGFSGATMPLNGGGMA